MPVIDRWVTVGSAEECEVRVRGDALVSGVHARVGRSVDGRVWVEDLGSMNGTWIQRAGRPRRSHPSLLPRVVGVVEWQRGDTIWLSRNTAIPWT